MEMLSDEQKYKQLESLFKKQAGRDFTPAEASHVRWICQWDMPTFNAYKSILQAVSKEQ